MPLITIHSTKPEVLAAVAESGLALKSASPDLQKDREVVLAAVARSGLALYYASAELQNDREVVLAAVAQDGLALKYASAELQNDREVVLAAVAQFGLALESASPELQNDQFLQRVSKLSSDKLASTFSALEPLKIKLKQEINLERKKAAATMISAMEEAIVSGYEQGEDFDLKQAFNQAIDTARPALALEQQEWWKKVIDAVFNAIINCFYPGSAEQKQGSLGKRFSFFANSNPVAKEIEDVQSAILNIS